MRLFAAALLLAAASLQADTFIIELNTEFSGASDPAGSPPWARATFEDIVPGTVKLTMEALLQGATEYISEMSFNLDPLLNPTSLTFAFQSGQAAQSITQDINCCQADGDGKFDIQFNFSTSGAGGGVNRFMMGETSIYHISGVASLVAADFGFQSAVGGGNGVWYSAAHVQGIGPTGALSGWIGGDTFRTPQEVIPEPTSILLLGTVLAGVTLVLRKRRTA